MAQSLLSDPNPSSPANQEAARLYAENRREYNRRVQQCATESWKAVETSESEPTRPAASSAAAEPGGSANRESASEEVAASGSSEAHARNRETQGAEDGGGETRP